MKHYQTECLNRDFYTLKGQSSYCLHLRMNDSRWDIVQTKKRKGLKKLKLEILKKWRKINGEFDFRFFRKKLNTL